MEILECLQSLKPFFLLSTLERGLGVETAKTLFFRGPPRRPTKLDDIHVLNPVHSSIYKIYSKHDLNHQ